MIAPLRRRVVVFAGGGTGGHLYPGLAVARALVSLEPVFLVPDDRGDRARVAGEFATLEVSCPRPGRAPLLFPARLARAVRRSRRVLRDLDAAAVVGLGGYGSVPAVLAARSLRLPVYLMECNAVPGRATRLLARMAAGIGLGSAGARGRLPSTRAACRVTGTPLRDELAARGAHAEFGLDPERRTLLVLGGSQGAEGLNTRVVEAVPDCADLEFQVLHCAGPRDADRVRRAYRDLSVRATVVDFVADVGRAYSVADLALCRAGASTVAECAAVGLPAVFVPYPWHRDRQQAHNAWEAVRAGAARVVAERDLDPATFRGLVAGVLLAPDVLRAMAAAARELARPAAARDMAAHLLESVGEAVAPAALPTLELGE